MNETTVIIVIAAWVAIGALTGLRMARRGHTPQWIFVAVVLGPLFVPIALERLEGDARTVPARPRAATTGRAGPTPRVLVGIDGSEESARVLHTALDLIGPRGEVTLTTVVSYEAADDAEDDDTVSEATGRLAELAAATTGMPVGYEVLAGSPGEALRTYAKRENMDLIVVGRRGRGRGRTAGLLGRVSTDLVHHSEVPVMVVEPQPSHADRPGAMRAAELGDHG